MEFALGTVQSCQWEKDRKLHPVAYLTKSSTQAKQNHDSFNKELLAIVASFGRWRHYLKGDPGKPEVIVYTNNHGLKRFMTM